jgi:hypothetical protein
VKLRRDGMVSNLRLCEVGIGNWSAGALIWVVGFVRRRWVSSWRLGGSCGDLCRGISKTV